MLDEVEQEGDAVRWVKRAMDRGDRLMGFGHRVYRAEDPRARVLRRTAKELSSPRVEVAEALEHAALDELKARYPDRVLATNVEFWSAVVLDFAEVPAHMFTAMFACARTAGWSAHILEQKRTGRLIRPVGDLHRPAVAATQRRLRRRDAMTTGHIGLLGGGVIGGGWAARFLLNGHDVVLFDPDPEAPRKIGEVLANARRANAKLTNAPWPAEGTSAHRHHARRGGRRRHVHPGERARAARA